MSEFGVFWHSKLEPGTTRYMAPELLRGGSFCASSMKNLSTMSDVYSLAVTSFSVRSSFVYRLLPETMLHFDQVLTGILAYGDHNGTTLDIGYHVRPRRPTDPSQNRWLQDPVWDVITTGWNRKPEQRCELSAMYRVFSKHSRQEAQNVKLGDWNLTTELLPRLRLSQNRHNVGSSSHG